MEQQVTVMQWYVVTGTAGATVSTPEGVTLCTIPDGGQGSFFAITPIVVTSDASVSVVKATFKQAPAKLRALGLIGGGVKYPGFDLKKYAECKTYDDVLAVNPDLSSDLTADGEWIYPLPKLQNMTKKNDVALFRKLSGLKKFNVDLPELTYAGWGFQFSTTLKEYNGALPKLKTGNAMFYETGIKEWTIDLPELTNGSNFLQNSPLVSFVAETPKWQSGFDAFRYCQLKSFVGALPSLSNGSGMFSYCYLDKDSVLRILTSLPSYTSGSHPITIGIHVDHQSDADVLAAIENAEAKGWTVAEQWNGTATVQTASTWGLRRPCIYAKVRETDLPDGTTERVLDWGHYVTNWEENGYQEFASEEEAKEYFNIGD